MVNKLKIKLIRPPMTMGFPGWAILPYGMGIITATLKDNGYEVNQDDLFARTKIHNSNLKLFSNNIINLGIFLLYPSKVKNCLSNGISDHSLNRLAEKLLNLTSYRDFDVIGFSLHSYSEFLFTLLLVERIKKEINVPIVLGGPFITLHADLYFERYEFIDYMIVGDGRIPFLKLLSFFEGNSRIEDIPNLFYRSNRIVHMNPREYFDIEDMPLPVFDGLPLESYKTDFGGKLFLKYQISRGCLGSCSFCTFRKVDEIPGIKSPEKVLNDLKEYSARYESKYFSMNDTTFNTFYEQIERICELLIQNKVDIKWEAFVKINNLDEKFLSKMKQAGCSYLKIGIESGSNRILQLMRKGFTVEQASKILEICHSLKIDTRIYLVVGYPHETQDDINSTIRFIKNNSKYIQSFSIFKFHIDYGSYIFDNPEEFDVENLRFRYNIFIFDEINGLKYKDKQKQQTAALFRILKAVYKDILFKRFHIGFIPFNIFLLSEKIFGNRVGRLLLALLPKTVLDLIYLLDPRYFGGGVGGSYGIYMRSYLFPFQRIPHNGLHLPRFLQSKNKQRETDNV